MSIRFTPPQPGDMASASHRVSLATLIARPGFLPKEPLRGGPPLDAEALAERLEQLLHSDPALFLERYGAWLQADELPPFEGGGYEVQWHLARLRRSTQQREQERRNRRFRCMADMLKGDSVDGKKAPYFSVERMQAETPARNAPWVAPWDTPWDAPWGAPRDESP